MSEPFHEINVLVNKFRDPPKEVIKHSCTVLCTSCRDKTVELAADIE